MTPVSQVQAGLPHEAQQHQPYADHVAPDAGARPLRVLGRFAVHVLLACVWIMVAVTAVVTWAPHVTKYKSDIIVGHSMEPTIPLYSVIVDEPVAPSRIRVGDIITFQEPDKAAVKVTHRVHRIVRSDSGDIGFVTKGDNNDIPDPWIVHYDDQAWRVAWHAPHVGWVLMHATTRGARLALVVLPVLVLLTMFLSWVWRNDDEDELVEDDDLAAWDVAAPDRDTWEAA